METGVPRFVDDMNGLGLDAKVESGLVTFKVTPVDGACAGKPVETGVSTEELGAWPQIPPHWVHFPASVRFAHTNSDQSTKESWLKHSRNITDWGAAEPGNEWASHVRAVLSEAIS